MNDAVSAILAIVGGVIGLATVAVILSPKAQTPAVLNSTGSALSNVITAAVSPVTGAVTGTGASGASGVGSILGQFGSSFGAQALSSFI